MDGAECAIPVSYTHLDVYKRQALYRDAPASLYLKAGILLLITMLPIYPVSYTHLRQASMMTGVMSRPARDSAASMSEVSASW